MAYLTPCIICESERYHIQQSVKKKNIITFMVVCDNCGHCCGVYHESPGDALQEWEVLNQRPLDSCPSCGSEECKVEHERDTSAPTVMYVQCPGCGLESRRENARVRLAEIWNNNDGAVKRVGKLKNTEGGS